MSDGMKLGVKIAGSLILYLAANGAFDKVVDFTKEKVKESKLKRTGARVEIDNVVYYAEIV